MGAIPVHHTAVDSSSAWDRSKVTATGKAELRYVSAWVDSSADAELIGSYKLMHHYKNDAPAILAGVNNAKARLSQTDMPQSDRAGVLAHLNAHQADAKQSILQKVQTFFQAILGNFFDDAPETNEQAVSMPNIYELVYAALNQNPEQESYLGLVDCYVNGSEMYAVISKDGLLYKSAISISGTGVTLGPLVLVEVNHNPPAQTIQTTRQANGHYRWFAFPAATAVLNRSGELDTRELFNNFVKRIENGDAPYPYLSFYHVGQAIRLGQADYVQADGYSLLISGLWLEDPLAVATRQALEKNPGYYGISIGYMYAPETKEQMQVGDGITIPVYTDGVLVECSILAEKDAACLFTGAYTEGVNRMNKKAKDELDKIVEGDPALQAQVAELEKHVDSVNANTEGLIRRDAEPETPEPAPVAPVEAAPAEAPAPVAEPPAEPTEVNFEMTDEMMGELVKRVADAVEDGILKTVAELANDSSKSFGAVNQQITALVARITKLEAPLEETVKQTIADMPRKATTVIYRPTQRQAAQPEDEEISYADRAAETLEKLH